MEKLNIISLFNEKDLTEKSDDDFKTVCFDCGLQGGRTEGFIIFHNNNTSFCHSSQKWFNLLQTAGLKFGIIRCLDGNDKGEIPEIEEETKQEIYESIKDEYTLEFLTEFKISCGDLEEFLIINTSPKGIITKTVNIDRVADYIIDKYDIKTIYGLKEESIYIYKEGIWTITGKGLIKSETEDLLGIWSKNNVVNEILEKIKRKTEITKKEFDITPELKTCLINGVLDIENIDKFNFINHSKEYNFKKKFPIEYNPKAECLKIKKFIKDTFYPADIPQVQQWFGHHLPKRYIFKKAVIIHGPKNTGKSVFLNLLTAFLGIDNVADLSLQKISTGKGFDLLVLKDKYGNIHDDLSSKDLNDGGGFKMCVGDGFIAGEEKFGDHQRFRNSAKMTFACNKIPPVKDIDDDAYYDRFLPWVLNNIIDSKEKNTKLINELTTSEELSGLFNWALEGYYKLIKQNHFSNEKTSEEIKDLMVENGNPLARFVSKILIESIGEKISKEEMYNQYCHYCVSEKPKLSPCSKDQLGKQLPRYAPYILSSSNGKERYWLNGKMNLHTNMTAITPFKKPYSHKENTYKESSNINNIKFPKASLLSSEKPTKIIKKVLQKKVTKKKTDREVQFFEADECKDIKPNHTKKQLLEWIKANPNKDYKKMYDKWGVGSFKFEAELKEEGEIK